VAVERGGRIEPYFESFTKFMEKYFDLRIEEVVRKTACLINNMGIEGNFLLGRDRILLAGEAAGFLNLLGEGISSALATGHIAGEAIHQAKASGETAISHYTNLAGPEQQLTTESWKLAELLTGRTW